MLPKINGITVPLDWSKIDTCAGGCTHGNYSWSTFDGSLSSYISGSGNFCKGAVLCKLNFEVNAASGSSPNTATPSYVFTLGWAHTCCGGTATPLDVCFCSGYPGSGSSSGCNQTDSSGVPASWERQFWSAYENFITEVITHFGSDASYKAQVGYIRLGIATGGGGVIPCPTQEMTVPSGAPLSLTVWQAYANTIFSYAASQSPPMIIEGSGYGGENIYITNAWADAVATAAISNGAGYGAESLAFHDLTLHASGSPCSNDWCNIFDSNFINSPKMLGLQTISPSDPSCTSDPGAALTCSLVYVLPFATERHANVFELGYPDLLCAYDNSSPEYTSAYCPSGYAPYGPYKTAIANAEAGVPRGTSVIGGSAKVSGSATVK